MVDRYTFNSAGEESVSDDGGYVEYGDYAELENRIAELEKQRDGLVAENAGLKDINAWCKTEAFSNMYREFKTAEALGCLNEDCMHDAMLVAIMHSPGTPATDAAIAEIGAKAVEEFAIYFAYEISELPEDDLLESAANYANKRRGGGV